MLSGCVSWEKVVLVDRLRSNLYIVMLRWNGGVAVRCDRSGLVSSLGSCANNSVRESSVA